MFVSFAIVSEYIMDILYELRISLWKLFSAYNVQILSVNSGSGCVPVWQERLWRSGDLRYSYILLSLFMGFESLLTLYLRFIFADTILSFPIYV